MRPRLATATAAALAAAAAIAGCGGSSSTTQDSPTSGSTATTPTRQTSTATTSPTPSIAPGPEGVPLEAGAALAPASTTTQGATVDGVRCQANEQVAYHHHAHLQVYADGLSRALPGAIGIVGPVVQQTAYGPFYSGTGCFYWLHTHTSDGVIHIESPTQQTYTLGDFFDVWRQPLSATQVGTLHGKVTASVNGKPWTKSPRDIPLVSQAEIQLGVGQPVPPYRPISWKGTGL